MLACQVGREGTFGEPGEVAGREGQQGIQDKGEAGADAQESATISRRPTEECACDLQRNLPRPDGEVRRILGGQITTEGGNVIDETAVVVIQARHVATVEKELRKGREARLLPFDNVGFNLGRPEEIRLVGGDGAFVLGRQVHVGTATIVFGTVATGRVSMEMRCGDEM